MSDNYKVITKTAISIQLGKEEEYLKEFMAEINDLIKEGWQPISGYTRDVQHHKYNATRHSNACTDSHATYTQPMYRPNKEEVKKDDPK